jgi:hypothetical protein
MYALNWAADAFGQINEQQKIDKTAIPDLHERWSVILPPFDLLTGPAKTFKTASFRNA